MSYALSPIEDFSITMGTNICDFVISRWYHTGISRAIFSHCYYNEVMVSFASQIARAGMVAKALRRRLFSQPTKFNGSPEDICGQILEKLWNGRFYQTGLGHFDCFWVRDFGTVAQSLISLGHEERVARTLRWAMARYRAAGKVTLCINARGVAFDMPEKSIDALPWLLYALRVANISLTKEDRDFLVAELHRFSNYFITPETGLIRAGAHFSEMRDADRYQQSAYAIALLASLVRDVRELDIPLPEVLQRANYAEELEMHYWNGNYYNADIETTAFSAECNLMPFVVGIVNDEKKLRSVLDVVMQKRLAKPIPMRYTDSAQAFVHRWWETLMMPNYAETTIWTWLGILYLHLLARAEDSDLPRALASFRTIIERHRNFPELLNPDGSWYESRVYRAEEGMIWSALYLDLVTRVQRGSIAAPRN